MSKSGSTRTSVRKRALQEAVLDRAAERFNDVVVRPAMRQPRGAPPAGALFDGYMDWLGVTVTGGALACSWRSSRSTATSPASFATGLCSLSRTAHSTILRDHRRGGRRRSPDRSGPAPVSRSRWPEHRYVVPDIVQVDGAQRCRGDGPARVRRAARRRPGSRGDRPGRRLKRLADASHRCGPRAETQCVRRAFLSSFIAQEIARLVGRESWYQAEASDPG